MIRLNKEIKLNNCKNINLKYGSVNKNDPQVIYVSGKMWLCPTYDGDYEEQVNLFHNSFKNKLKNALSNSIVFDKKHILDFDINPENLIKDKKKFFSISFFLKQKSEKIINLNNIKNIISSNFGYLFKELEDELVENEFEVSKTKQSMLIEEIVSWYEENVNYKLARVFIDFSKKIGIIDEFNDLDF